MDTIRQPIFKNKLPKISWKKIYEREYGVQYSELAVSVLATADYHFPKLSVTQVVVPGEGHNTAFYIDNASWTELVEGLNEKYTADLKNLEAYEKQFSYDGKKYLSATKKVSKLNLKNLTNKELLSIFLTHQNKRERYSVFAWTGFILNHYVADRATTVLEPYIKKYRKENQRQEIIDALFRPEKRAAIHQLQYEVEKQNGKLTEQEFDNLYQRFKWISCLDIHNKAWTKQEFKKHIKSFTKKAVKKQISFKKVIDDLRPTDKDLKYLLMAKRFAYIMDARDDYRRESVFYAGNLYKELARRMGVTSWDVSFIQEQEIINFLVQKSNVSKKLIYQRQKGFVIYLDINKKLICLQGNQIKKALQMFHLVFKEEKIQNITGRVASRGMARGNVVIVKGVKDIVKVKKGNILVAVTTHPDYVPAMRKTAAIVTDEGGITSHAAIVSREFGIPCIVGTKTATKVLKDGDLVEVDANKGIVKIIERA